MKQKTSILFIITILLFNCNASKDLIKENELLKAKIEALKTSDTSRLKAVLETSNLNIVYRGVRNPLRISFPNAVKITASGEGLNKKNDFGDYEMVPLSGRTVDITINAEMIDGSIITDVKTLRIKNLGKLVGKINSVGCGNKCDVLMKKQKLKGAKITAILGHLLYDDKINVIEFKIHLRNHKPIKVEGNIITEKTFNQLKEKISINDELVIFDIKVTSSLGLRMKPAAPIGIKIIE